MASDPTDASRRRLPAVASTSVRPTGPGPRASSAELARRRPAGWPARRRRARPGAGRAGSRRRARSRRLVRLRTTAPPTALDTTKPTRGGRPARASVGLAWTTISLEPARQPSGGADRRREVRPLDAVGSAPAAPHGLRRRARSGPCDDGRRGWRGPRGCACAGGSRGSWPGDGCSAGRSACSRCSLIWWRAGWARVVGEPVAFGCHRKPMTLRGEAAPSRRGSRACENSRPTGPSTVRESGHEGQTGRSGVPDRRKRPRISRSHGPPPGATRPSATTRHTHSLWTTMWTRVGSRTAGRTTTGPRGSGRTGSRVADATMTQLWRTTLEVLDSDGIPVQQRAFLSLARLVGLLDDTALIAVPNDFTKDIVETRLRDRVTATLGSQLGRDVRLAVTVDPSLADAPSATASTARRRAPESLGRRRPRAARRRPAPPDRRPRHRRGRGRRHGPRSTHGGGCRAAGRRRAASPVSSRCPAPAGRAPAARCPSRSS